MSEELAKVWITKYALSGGVFSAWALISPETGPGHASMIEYKIEGSRYAQYAHGNDWHRSEEAAIKRAEEMRVKKISSLEKQMKKLEQLKFMKMEDGPC